MNTDYLTQKRVGAGIVKKEMAGGAIGLVVGDSFDSRPGLIGLLQSTIVLLGVKLFHPRMHPDYLPQRGGGANTAQT
jgi:hypothetical protein